MPSDGSKQPIATEADTLPQRLRRANGLDLDLKREAADEIERLTVLREEDGRAMSALIDGYQRMLRACIDGTADEWHRDVMSAMSDEITRLRQVFLQQNLTLTDEEREAIAAGLGALERLYEDSPPISQPIYEQHAPTLRRLLERTK